MYYLINYKNKIIFGWSAKCGCSHIKNLFYFFETGNLENPIHTFKDIQKLPNDIENYTTIIFSRNPYKRIISGFLDKYSKSGPYRYKWKESFLSFSQFVDKLIIHDWESIEYHHFTPQTTEDFNNKIFFSKQLKFYDICKIDYNYLENLFNIKIPEYIMNKKQGHERIFFVKKEEYYDKYVYDLNIDEYIDYNIDIKYFYNKEIKEKVFNFYINDFTFFKENGIDYINSEF